MPGIGTTGSMTRMAGWLKTRGGHHFIVQRGQQYARWCKLELYKEYNTDAAAGNLPLNLPDIKTDRVRHLCITDHVDHPSTSAR